MPEAPLPSSLGSVGLLIREHRRTKGLTQEEAAARAGVSVGTWRNTETGRRRPRPETFQAILATLDMDREEVHEAVRSPVYVDAGAARRELLRLCESEMPDDLVDLFLWLARLSVAGYRSDRDVTAATT